MSINVFSDLEDIQAGLVLYGKDINVESFNTTRHQICIFVKLDKDTIPKLTQKSTKQKL